MSKTFETDCQSIAAIGPNQLRFNRTAAITRASASILDTGLIDQHHGNLVTNRVNESALLIETLEPRLVFFEQNFGFAFRATKYLEQFGAYRHNL